MKKHYYLTFDTETCNSLDCPIMYDLGGCIHDRYGNVIETFSFVIYETFVEMKELMKTAYYAEKIEQYEKEIKEGARKLVTLKTARNYFHRKCKEYNVRAIIAHNARFDYKSTQTTQRYITKSAYRYFLPYGIELWDTLKMSRQFLKDKPMYRRFCELNGYMTKNNQPRYTAEILYRWITRNTDFVESHTGLEDVLIEKEIFSYIVRQGVFTKIEKRCFAD